MPPPTKILVVDDDRLIRLQVRSLLERSNYCCIESADGRRALDVLTDNPTIALVVTDMVMPNVDGRQLVESMQEIPALREIPVIITSGIVSARSVRDLLHAGAERFIAKPIQARLLLGYVTDLIGGATGRAV